MQKVGLWVGDDVADGFLMVCISESSQQYQCKQYR